MTDNHVKPASFAAGLPGGSTQADSAEIMGLRPMGGPLSYKQQTQVRFLQLRLAGRQLYLREHSSAGGSICPLSRGSQVQVLLFPLSDPYSNYFQISLVENRILI